MVMMIETHSLIFYGGFTVEMEKKMNVEEEEYEEGNIVYLVTIVTEHGCIIIVCL